MDLKEMKFEIDIKGVQLFEGITFVPSGVYEFEAVSIEPHKGKVKQGDKFVEGADFTSWKLVLAHTDEKFKGIQQFFYLGLNREEEGVKRQWLGLLHSLFGNDEAKLAKALDSGNFKINAHAIMHKNDGSKRKLYGEIKTPPPGANGIDLNDVSKNFCSPKKYNAGALPEPFPAGYGARPSSGTTKKGNASANGAAVPPVVNKPAAAPAPSEDLNLD